jgi:hypothetical protein
MQSGKFWVFGQRAIIEYLKEEEDFKEFFDSKKDVEFTMLNEVLFEINNLLINEIKKN